MIQLWIRVVFFPVHHVFKCGEIQIYSFGVFVQCHAASVALWSSETEQSQLGLASDYTFCTCLLHLWLILHWPQVLLYQKYLPSTTLFQAAICSVNYPGLVANFCADSVSCVLCLWNLVWKVVISIVQCSKIKENKIAFFQLWFYVQSIGVCQLIQNANPFKMLQLQSPQASLLSVFLDGVSLLSFASFLPLSLVSKSYFFVVFHKVSAFQTSCIIMIEVDVKACRPCHVREETVGL